MVKRGYIKCDKCGRQFKGAKSFSHHQCKPEGAQQPPSTITIVKCLECGKEVTSKHFNDHQRRCEARRFLEDHRKFFKFFCRVVRRHNIVLRREEDKAIHKEALDYVADCTVGNHEINELDEKLLEVAAEKIRRREREIEALKEAENLGIKFGENIPMQVVKDAFKGLVPRISARQVIFAYLKENELYTPNIKKWINISFGGKDYATDDEIAKSPILYNQVHKVRGLSSYNDTFQRFYYMVAKYFNDNDSYKCDYCDEYVLNIRDHIKTCISFKNLYDSHREDTITTFIKKFYEDKLIEKDYYLEYYKESTPEYFLSTIHEHMKDKIAFIEKKEDEEMKIEPPKKEKWDIKAFVKEVDKDVGPDELIKERYTIPFTYIDKEENLLLKEPVIIEDIHDMKYTKIKIKDPLAPSILACKDPIDNKPKVVFDEKRGVMTFAEPPKPKVVEPPKEEPKDEEIEEDKPVEDLPEDFDLFEYDILNNKK
ncbi:MAG: hypothetical protein J6T10_15155 [Methanobrevibacter sp.]|nr:hypothetical protein [Methanobrevibacter sp.]